MGQYSQCWLKYAVGTYTQKSTTWTGLVTPATATTYPPIITTASAFTTATTTSMLTVAASSSNAATTAPTRTRAAGETSTPNIVAAVVAPIFVGVPVLICVLVILLRRQQRRRVTGTRERSDFDFAVTMTASPLPMQRSQDPPTPSAPQAPPQVFPLSNLQPYDGQVSRRDFADEQRPTLEFNHRNPALDRLTVFGGSAAPAPACKGAAQRKVDGKFCKDDGAISDSDIDLDPSE